MAVIYALGDVVQLFQDRFESGYYFDDDGTAAPESSLRQVPIDAQSYDANGRAMFAPERQRVLDHGHLISVCKRCGQPAFSITRHAVGVHGDRDVELYVGPPKSRRPEWLPASYV